MAVTNAAQVKKSVADPMPSYDSMRNLWEKSRAVIGGERFTKDYDGIVDTINFENLLLPFSPSMTPQQYNFYKAEAELPGIVSQYARIIIGGLLRKQPQLKLPDGVPADAYDWIMSEFTQEGMPLVSFLDESLWEEVQTSRAWVYVDYPRLENPEALTREEQLALKPYPVHWKAESLINYKFNTDKTTSTQTLEKIIIRNYEEVFKESNEFHPELLDTVWVHELVDGLYQIRKFQRAQGDALIPVVNGQVQQKYVTNSTSSVNTATQGAGALSEFLLVDTNTQILVNGERLTFIPAWPLNGSIKICEPMLMNLIDREVALYNKVSRRNHLLYGAATYTPVISSDMSDEQFSGIVDGGLGAWIHLNKGDTATVLDTPTGALADMDRSIAATLDEMARMGLRMLAPESSQSGVALDIRNAAQTAQLGTLNTKVGNQMASIIAFMLNWRYDLQLRSTDIGFELSADFNPAPLGADWLRLATEWYEKGLLPRSSWLALLKQNDMVPADYDDEEGKVEITGDEMVFTTKEDMDYALQQKQQQADLAAQASQVTQGPNQVPQ